jgi:hypothetical protein
MLFRWVRRHDAPREEILAKVTRRKRSTASPIRDADELIDEATQRLAAIERALEAFSGGGAVGRPWLLPLRRNCASKSTTLKRGAKSRNSSWSK